MDEYIVYKLLNFIDKKESIGTLFKLGYSYSNIISWYFELEKYGYVITENNEYRVLTESGKQKLKELEKRGRKNDIGKLEQYQNVKITLEDIYLP